MQLPKYSARDTLLYTPDRAKHAVFTFEDKVWCLIGLSIDGDTYMFEDIDMVPRGARLGLYATPFEADFSSEAQELPHDCGAVEALCEFVPPSSLFTEPYTPNAKLHVVRRRRSYSPFISPYSVCAYYPYIRSDRTVRWSEAGLTTTSLCRLVSGDKFPYDWDVAATSLAIYGYSTMHPDTGVVFVGSHDYQVIKAFDGPTCRVELGDLSRRGGIISSPNKDLLAMFPDNIRQE